MNFVDVVRGLVGECMTFSSLLRSLGKLMKRRDLVFRRAVEQAPLEVHEIHKVH